MYAYVQCHVVNRKINKFQKAVEFRSGSRLHGIQCIARAIVSAVDTIFRRYIPARGSAEPVGFPRDGSKCCEVPRGSGNKCYRIRSGMEKLYEISAEI